MDCLKWRGGTGQAGEDGFYFGLDKKLVGIYTVDGERENWYNLAILRFWVDLLSYASSSCFSSSSFTTGAAGTSGTTEATAGTAGSTATGSAGTATGASG